MQSFTFVKFDNKMCSLYHLHVLKKSYKYMHD